MMTLTLFEISTIIGFCLTSETFYPNESDENTIIFDVNCASFGKYIEDYHVADTTEVSDEEHIAFLEL